jgi:AcrR family transcriptional regulator
MPRPAKHDESSILKATAAIVASRGPNAATITAIGHAIGAPSGPIYHRFQTRDELLGRLWLNKAAFSKIDGGGAEQARCGVERHWLQLSLSRIASRGFLAGARIMLLHRREDFLSDTWPAEMQAEAQRLGEQVQDSLAQITRQLFGRNSAFGRQVATFAVLDIPFSAVRRFVAMGQLPPPAIDDLVTTAHKAIILQHRPKR